jgi:DNA topoisomerase-6 subunit B
VRQEGERREIFLRYLGEVARAVATIKDYGDRPRKDLYGRLVDVAKRKTAVADTELNGDGKQPESGAQELGENVLIVDQEETAGDVTGVETSLDTAR